MELFWSGFLLSLSLCLDLGIVNVAAMRVGVQHGARASFALGAGSCCGDLVYAGLALAGVAAALELPAVRWILWIGGSAVLVWLCGKAVLDARPRGSSRLPTDRDAAPDTSTSLIGHFMYGVALALSSPSAILWFATVGGAVIATTASGSREAAIWFFTGFFLSGLAWSLVVAVAASHGRRFGPRFERAFAIASAVIFAVLAINVFLDGYRTLIEREA